ncbi:MAG: cyclase family protein [Clostridia bacterium]
MKWLDITLPLRETMPHWPGDVPFRHQETAWIGVENCPYNLSWMQTSTHFGTHIDAPFHFVANGRKVEELDLNTLIGPCVVLDLTGVEKRIEAEDLRDRIPDGTKRLLLKTRNSVYIREAGFREDYVALSPDAVRYVLQGGVLLLGIDYYSIGPFGEEGTAVHQIFLRPDNTIALEGVDLSEVEAGEYLLLCLHIKVEGASGAQARVLLGKEEK